MRRKIQMIRKILHVLVLACVVLLALVSVRGPSHTAAQEGIEWQCPPEFAGQTLNIYNWSLFIGEETIPTFEKLCDVEVVYDVFDTTEQVINRLREGNPGYDVVYLSDFMVTLMSSEGLLEPLDFSKIPNFANIGDEFKNPTYDPDNQYSVPYTWGTSGVAYNVNNVEGEVTSWQDLFDYDGPVAWLDDSATMLAIGLIMLGYDPNSTDESQIEEARDYLIEHSDNVKTIAVSDGQILLETGEVDMVILYSGELFQLASSCECDDFAYVIPEEGSNIYVDTMTIPVGARNPDLAHVYIDYILDPHVGAAIANDIGYATPNQQALDLDLILPEYRQDPIIYLPSEVIERLYYLELNPDIELARLDAWDEITLTVGE
jgi:spermidine/putrescine transport system substrate-binding protein